MNDAFPFRRVRQNFQCSGIPAVLVGEPLPDSSRVAARDKPPLAERLIPRAAAPLQFC